MPPLSGNERLPRVGIELELLAPPGLSRRDLARVLAGEGGRVEVFLHPDTEPALVPGTPVFDNLTLGFVARDASGAEVARCVDDLTLQDDLDRKAPPTAGWWRIVSDDRRLLHLVRRHGRADQGPLGALSPLARLFGTEVETLPGDILRVRDPDGMPVAMAAPLPGERQRPCELITPPLPAGPPDALLAALERLLEPARRMGFAIPAEAAVHLHLDAAPLRNARVFADLVEALHPRREALRAAFRTNPRCRRLGPWPDALLDTVRTPGFRELSWDEAILRLRPLSLSKYTDLNLRNVVHEVPGKPTFEVRILPGAIEAGPVVEALTLLCQILRPIGALEI